MLLESFAFVKFLHENSMFAQRRLTSDCTFAQCYQSLHRALCEAEDLKRPQADSEGTECMLNRVGNAVSRVYMPSVEKRFSKHLLHNIHHFTEVLGFELTSLYTSTSRNVNGYQNRIFLFSFFFFFFFNILGAVILYQNIAYIVN